MIKKCVSAILAAILLTGVTSVMTACRKKEKPIDTVKTEFDYDALYRSNLSEPYAEVASGGTNKARYGYTLKAEQGYNGWYYLYDDGSGYKNMTYSNNEWIGGGSSINGAEMRSAKKTSAVRKFVVTGNGNAVVYGNFKCSRTDSAAATVKIFLNNSQIYSGRLEKGDLTGKYFKTETRLTDGDNLYFKVDGDKSNVLLDPVVSYDNTQNASLYHLTSFGKSYGDVFPYYDEKNRKLYMGFLWTDDARLNDYKNALEVSENMLTFTNIPEANNYDVWRHYKENGRLHFLYDCNNFIDRTKYTFGIRDNMLHFDEVNKRFLLIGGCYYEFNGTKQTSDLAIYASDDPIGFSWTKAGNVVAGYSRNLPECPELMKIGNRWYVFVSVAYNTVHQVGPLQYWTGDENVDCMDVNWSNKSFSFLDGEDLCAARPVKVGGKVYMWGWIPNLYDAMPWSPWGGYLNLPREVVQHADGSLGGRLDPGLSKLLNYGNIYRLADGNYGIISGNASYSDGKLQASGETLIALGGAFNRNYITFSVDMQNSESCGYVMRQGDREYRAVIEKENGKTFLKVLSPNDPNHKINSTIEIKDTRCGVFDVKLVIDGGIMEFFVNDEYALTAHTAMTAGDYGAFLYSSDNAAYTSVAINKLIPYFDIA